jgi:hypothetical protein
MASLVMSSPTASTETRRSTGVANGVADRFDYYRLGMVGQAGLACKTVYLEQGGRFDRDPKPMAVSWPMWLRTFEGDPVAHVRRRSGCCVGTGQDPEAGDGIGQQVPEAGCFLYRPSIDRLFWLSTGGADRSRPLTRHPDHDRGSSASEGLLGGPLSRGRTGRAQRHRESMSGLNYPALQPV